MKKKTEEDLMMAYVASEETPITKSPFKDATVEVVQQPADPQAQEYKSMAEIARENRTHGREGIPVTGNGSGLKYKDNIGWLKIDVKTLPTQGLFYPDGFEISIRAARGEEIKHWSTMNDQDINQLSRVDDILNYMIEKCFIFNVAGNPMKVHVPSLGVNDWLKKYVAQKINAKEGYDEDFITYAPMLIKDYRGLGQRAYEEMVGASRLWNVKEWSVLAYVTEKLGGATEPKIKYINEDGGEVEIPLTFRGGIRSLFVLSNPLLSIC